MSTMKFIDRWVMPVVSVAVLIAWCQAKNWEAASAMVVVFLYALRDSINQWGRK